MNTAFSAQGHFYSASMKKREISFLLFANLSFAIISITDFGICPIVIKVVGIISLIASIWLLINESQEGKSSFRNHMITGEKYLTLHYDLQFLFYKGNDISQEELNNLRIRYNDIRTEDQPMIPPYAYKKAQHAIKEGKMNIWW